MTDSPPGTLVITETIFPLGDISPTQGVLAEIPHDEVQTAVNRHASGDWGQLDAHDLQENARALKEGARLVSRYESRNGTVFWIITEWDRSRTTILLPMEY